jgi:hypothetical protein
LKIRLRVVQTIPIDVIDNPSVCLKRSKAHDETVEMNPLRGLSSLSSGLGHGVWVS